MVLATDFSTRGRRVRTFALPLTLAGAGCHHGSRQCWTCVRLADAYAASLRWASGLVFDPDPYDPELDAADQTLVQLGLPGFEASA